MIEIKLIGAFNGEEIGVVNIDPNDDSSKIYDSIKEKIFDIKFLPGEYDKYKKITPALFTIRTPKEYDIIDYIKAAHHTGSEHNQKFLQVALTTYEKHTCPKTLLNDILRLYKIISTPPHITREDGEWIKNIFTKDDRPKLFKAFEHTVSVLFTTFSNISITPETKEKLISKCVEQYKDYLTTNTHGYKEYNQKCLGTRIFNELLEEGIDRNYLETEIFREFINNIVEKYQISNFSSIITGDKNSDLCIKAVLADEKNMQFVPPELQKLVTLETQRIKKGKHQIQKDLMFHQEYGH